MVLSGGSGSAIGGAGACCAVFRLGRFGGLMDFAFAIVALTWTVVTFSPPAARSMISSRASSGVDGAAAGRGRRVEDSNLKNF
jgi:hypothetical protein